MPKKISFYLLLIVLIGLCAGCDSKPRIATLGQNTVVLAVGDSLTYGTGATSEQSYPSVLAVLLGRPVINSGIPGEISENGLDRLSKELDKHAPTLVILCHGGNDFLRRLDTEKTKKNIQAMIEMVRFRGADIVLLGVPKLGWGLSIPSFYRDLADNYKIPFEDEILVTLLTDNSKKSDTIHPNAIGYRLMAESIRDLINKSENE